VNSTQRVFTNQMKATTEEIIAAYQATGSVWKAAKELGMAGQTVHERLQLVGYPLLNRNWTDDEIEEMRSLIGESVPLGQVASRLGRPYAGVACKASELGIRSNQKRAKKIPRGAGWDKATTLRHMKALFAYQGKITQYARANGLSIETLVQALQKHCPDDWIAYKEQRSDLPRKVCPYCETEFIPMSGKQEYCTRVCAGDARRDRDYFGGNRRSTIGLAEGVCQLCERTGVKGLSSHHVIGKENDPDNQVLIALCQGCHKLVTLLASRTFIDDSGAWENLISLAHMRKRGPEIGSGELDGMAVYVSVQIEVEPDDEEVERWCLCGWSVFGTDLERANAFAAHWETDEHKKKVAS